MYICVCVCVTVSQYMLWDGLALHAVAGEKSEEQEQRKKTDTHYNYLNEPRKKNLQYTVQGQKFEKTLQQHLIFPI